MVIVRVVFALVLSQTLFAQTSGLLSKAPPDVDEALRSRVKEFYEMQMKAKFRASESYVCEESRDRYYAADKRQWTSMQIMRIEYGEGFREAKVTAALGSEFINRAGRMPVTFPFTGTWKVENGAWCYYLPPPESTGIATPFGTMTGKPATIEAVTPPGKPIDPAILANAVRMSRQEVAISAKAEGVFEVGLENTLQGSVRLEVYPPAIDGLTATVGKTDLGPGEKTSLTISYKPGPKAPPPVSALPIHAEPVGQKLSLKLTFTQ